MLCSQEDGNVASGGAYNLFGEPIPLCAEHLSKAVAQKLTVEQVKAEMVRVYGGVV